MEVVVVGAGVSGCACAAALSSFGLAVTVVNSALDSVGQPGYGPDVTAGSGGWGRIRRVMDSLPAVLRAVWLDAAVSAEGSGAFFAVDRRMLSVEAKRALEYLPGLRFRQGLVVGLSRVPPVRPDGGVRWAVETAFGERIEGDIVVIAVGLGLAGRVAVGRDVSPGGRYGEAFGEGLAAACEGLGARFAEVEVVVGQRVAVSRLRSWDASAHVWCERGECAKEGGSVLGAVETVPLAELLDNGPDSVGFGAAGDTGREPESAGDRAASVGRFRGEWGTGTGECEWPAEYPPAPYWIAGLRWGTAVLRRGEGDAVAPVALPDGLTTGEVYVVPDGARGGSAEAGKAEIEARPRHRVRGVRVANLSEGGRLTAGDAETYPVWIVGRAGGAEGYLDSLESAMRVAEDIRSVVRADAGMSGGDV